MKLFQAMQTVFTPIVDIFLFIHRCILTEFPSKITIESSVIAIIADNERGSARLTVTRGLVLDSTLISPRPTRMTRVCPSTLKGVAEKSIHSHIVFYYSSLLFIAHLLTSPQRLCPHDRLFFRIARKNKADSSPLICSVIIIAALFQYSKFLQENTFFF